jgi:hypothetical protein
MIVPKLIRQSFVDDAHRDGKRFIVRADEKLTAFIELDTKRAADISLSQK